LENVALWHERDISHSSAERIILPDSCILLDYMLAKLRDVVEKLQVYPERMRKTWRLPKVCILANPFCWHSRAQAPSARARMKPFSARR